jgi:G3E family GTPase
MTRGRTVPVVLLTGFLGSGKTTLLNRLIAARSNRPAGPTGVPPSPTGVPPDADSGVPAPRDHWGDADVRSPRPDQWGGAGKLAILVNELGSIGIDASLLPDGAARQVELPGGCICCTLDENLEKSLGELLAPAPDLELVIIETTGIAEPLPILWTLTGEPLAGRVRVAAVVTVVDSLEHQCHRPMAPAVDNQVEHADILVVSKLDTLDPADAAARLAGLEPALRELNPGAALLAERDPADSAAALLTLLEDPALDSATARRPLARPHRHGDHPIEALAVPIGGTLDFEELAAELEALPASYVRIKGIAHAIDRSTGSDEARWIAFHRVGARVSAELLPPAGESPSPRMVALGFGLDPDRLAACLRASVIRSG